MYNFFIKLNAIDALVDLGRSEAIAALNLICERVVEPRTFRAALTGVKALRESTKGSNESLEALKTELDLLKEELRTLKTKIKN